MGFGQIFGGCRPPKYLTDGVPSNIWGVYTPKIFDGWGSVKYLGGLQPPNISRMGFRQIFGGSTPPKYFTDGVRSNIWGCRPPKYLTDGVPTNIWGLYTPKYFTDGVPSNIWGVYTPKMFLGWSSVKYLGAVHPQKIFDGWGSVKYLGGLHPQNISQMGFRLTFGGSTPPKYLTDGFPSNIWGVYSPEIFHGTTSVKDFGGVDREIISRMGFRQIFGSCTPPKYLTDGVSSNIWGVYTPKIFHGWGSVKYLGGVNPQKISRMGFRQIFGSCTAPKYLTDGVPSNIWGVYTPKIIHGWGSVKYFGGLQPPNIFRMGFRQIFGGCRPPK